MALLSTTLSYAELGDADLVIEAVFEEIGVKQTVFEQLDAVMKPGAILASNTSTLDLDKIASFTKRPQDVIGMHFFSPANVMRLLEVVRGAKTAPRRAGDRDEAGQEDQEDLRGLGRVRRLHRQPHDRAVQPPGRLPAGRGLHAAAGGQGGREVRLRDGPVPHGRPGRQRHRLGDPQAPLRREARTCATRRRPTCCARWAATARRPAPAGTTTCRASATRSRRSWSTTCWASTAPSWASRRARSATTRSCIAWCTRWSTRARSIVEEGIALRASDIDMVYLTGYGFPLWRGGPMNYADTVGLWNVVQAMKKFSQEPGRRPGVLAARAAAGQAGRRRQELQLRHGREGLPRRARWPSWPASCWAC